MKSRWKNRIAFLYEDKDVAGMLLVFLFFLGLMIWVAFK
jgi:hypothetical protein